MCILGRAQSRSYSEEHHQPIFCLETFDILEVKPSCRTKNDLLATLLLVQGLSELLILSRNNQAKSHRIPCPGLDQEVGHA